MLTRFLTPAFVTTVSVLADACTKAPKNDPPPTAIATSADADVLPNANPPAVVQAPDVAAASFKKRKRTRTVAKGALARRTQRPAKPHYPWLNPKHDGLPIMLLRDDSCWVDKAGTKEQIDCPAEMDDPAWDLCEGRLVIDEDTKKCFCRLGPFAVSNVDPNPEFVTPCTANAEEILKKKVDP